MKSRLLVAAVGIPLLLVILFACPTIVTAVAISLLSAIGAREFTKTTGINQNEGMILVTMAAAFLLPIWGLFWKPDSRRRGRHCSSGPGAVCPGAAGLSKGEV